MNATNFDGAATTLEFDKITAMLADCAATDGAKALARRLMPTNDAEGIKRKLELVESAKQLCMVKGTPSFGNVKDIVDSVERAEKGAVLSPRELLDCAGVLNTARRLRDYYFADLRDEGKHSRLGEYFSRMLCDRTLETEITRAIIAEDLISDDASPALSDIRRKIRVTNNKIKDTLQRYVSGEGFSEALRENIVTMRNGRYVVPVRADRKNEIKGLVHDTSSSGATVFVEPMAVVEANNELRELQSKEAHEIERILSELSSHCAESSGVLRSDFANITELAFIFAKAELSFRMNACAPKINENNVIKLVGARHPLIDGKKVVPITIALGEAYDTIVITGPNTGGKTVALKTLGLFTLMAQAGLHIPCDAGSEIAVLDSVLADVGDEQSIEQSLSTFSAHMVNIVKILKCAGPKSLVLFDELGAGTDPTEGASLAIAVIERVRSLGALCAATTHYAEMKAFALDTEGVINASCEFDVTTLRPTYRLIIGTPGKSNAFAISLKLGLDPAIIEAAKEHIGSDDRRFENVVEKLESSRIAAEKEREEASAMRREFERYKAEQEAKIKQLLESAEKEHSKAAEKAARIISDARVTSEYVFEELEKIKKKKESERFADELGSARSAIRKSLRQSEDAIDPVTDIADDDYVLPRALVRGDEVLIANIGRRGVLVDNPDKDGNVTVRSGLVNTKTKIKNLRLIEGATSVTDANRKKVSSAAYRAAVNKNFTSSIDLRGQTSEDAWFMTDKYLDEAQVANVSTVTLIHGKGTGALRSALQKYLKSDPRVKSFRAGMYGEGDAGVTVVELKK